MARTEEFDRRINLALSRAEESRTIQMHQVSDEMERRVHLQTAFEQLAADRLHRLEIRPRVEALARHFDNAHVQHFKTPVGTIAVCTLARTARYPAATTLTIGVVFDADRIASSITYRLQIIPVLMEFEGADELPVELDSPDIDSVTSWVEQKLEAFVDTYLSLENNPRYRHNDQHVDPVCGMIVHGGCAACSCKYGNRMFYFCTPACQAKFESSPAYFGDHAPQALVEVGG